MIEKVKVILRDGSLATLPDWQRLYGLSVYSNAIGHYFRLDEHPFSADLAEYGELVVSELLMRVLDEYRRDKKKATSLNSFNRNDEKQESLKARGFRTATHSPHVVKLAGDVDTPGIKELRASGYEGTDEMLWKCAVEINRLERDRMLKVAKKLGIQIRVGNEDYLEKKQTFIHVDVCPEYYGTGKPWHHHEHPRAWEIAGLTW